MALLSREVCARWLINGDAPCVCFVTPRVFMAHGTQRVCVRCIKGKTGRLTVQVGHCVAPAAPASEKDRDCEHETLLGVLKLFFF